MVLLQGRMGTCSSLDASNRLEGMHSQQKSIDTKRRWENLAKLLILSRIGTRILVMFTQGFRNLQKLIVANQQGAGVHCVHVPGHVPISAIEMALSTLRISYSWPQQVMQIARKHPSDSRQTVPACCNNLLRGHQLFTGPKPQVYIAALELCANAYGCIGWPHGSPVFKRLWEDEPVSEGVLCLKNWSAKTDSKTKNQEEEEDQEPWIFSSANLRSTGAALDSASSTWVSWSGLSQFKWDAL